MLSIKFFTNKQPELSFEWNAASQFDWPIIRRNFVAAYISSYKDRSFDELKYPNELKLQAEQIWDNAYGQGFEIFSKQIIQPLQFYLYSQRFYMAEEATPLTSESERMKHHFSHKDNDISAVRERIVKLLVLQKYFEHDFDEEKHKIDSKSKVIDYLIVRFHGRPIAFFVCELNHKSAKVYLRFVTIEPAFHRESLGEKILDHIVQRYPDATGLELYTRIANFPARAFYQHYGFQPFNHFLFGKPSISLEPKSKLYFPDDDATSHPEAFIAFSKHTNLYRG